MSKWSPVQKTSYFLMVVAIFYGICLYHFPDLVALLLTIATMTFAVITGFFAEATESPKMRRTLWISGLVFIIVSTLAGVVEILSNPFGTSSIASPTPTRLAILLVLFNLFWSYKSNIFRNSLK